MRRLLNIIGATALLATAAACATAPAPARAACYWMTNDGAQWVEFSEVRTKTQCFALDSCSGGQGLSGGGCYKWAPGAAAPAEPW